MLSVPSESVKRRPSKLPSFLSSKSSASFQAVLKALPLVSAAVAMTDSAAGLTRLLRIRVVVIDLCSRSLANNVVSSWYDLVSFIG